MWCTADTLTYVRHMCAKGFLNPNFNLAVIDKIANFHEIAPKFHIFIKIIILKYNWTN